jgi:hypothetical protein
VSDLTCTNCTRKKPKIPKIVWWSLNGYFGIHGLFCAKCYRKVQHDAYSKPYCPVAYRRVLKKQMGVVSEH